jgi:hypothetical protein
VKKKTATPNDKSLDDLTADDYREMIKLRKPEIKSKTLLAYYEAHNEWP